VRDQLSSEKLKREGFFQPAYVERLLREHEEGVRDHRKLLWTLLVFELWQERYLSR
jgi:asparagine synthase (glutamine-hydrolysing)